MFRSITFLLLSLLMAQSSYAGGRLDRTPLWYARVGPNIGNFYGLHLSAGAIVKIRHELSLGWEPYFKRAANFPADYDCPSCHHGVGNDWIEGATLSYGYVMYPRIKSVYARMVLRTGLLIGRQRTFENFRPTANPAPYESNYEFDENEQFSAGLLIRPTFDLPMAKAVGISIGPYGLFSRDFVCGGISIAVLVGHVGFVNIKQQRRQPPAAHP